MDFLLSRSGLFGSCSFVGSFLRVVFSLAKSGGGIGIDLSSLVGKVASFFCLLSESFSFFLVSFRDSFLNAFRGIFESFAGGLLIFASGFVLAFLEIFGSIGSLLPGFAKILSGFGGSVGSLLSFVCQFRYLLLSFGIWLSSCVVLSGLIGGAFSLFLCICKSFGGIVSGFVLGRAVTVECFLGGFGCRFSGIGQGFGDVSFCFFSEFSGFFGHFLLS